VQGGGKWIKGEETGFCVLWHASSQENWEFKLGFFVPKGSTYLKVRDQRTEREPNTNLVRTTSLVGKKAKRQTETIKHGGKKESRSCRGLVRTRGSLKYLWNQRQNRVVNKKTRNSLGKDRPGKGGDLEPKANKD